MRLLFGVLALLLLPVSARAGAPDDPPALLFAHPILPAWHIDWLSGADGDDGPLSRERSPFIVSLGQQQAAQPVHPSAIQHSDEYLMRAKIHKYASFATLPLFAAELALGQSLYNSSSGESGKGLHAAVGSGIIGLFAANTVTGVWNMYGAEGRQETDGRGLRLVHGLLMMAAEAGFLATWATAPSGDNERRGTTNQNDKSTHRTIAITSISVGTAGYLVMLLANR